MFPSFRRGAGRPLPPIPSQSQASSKCTNSQPQIPYHHLLDATTVEVGFNYTCLEGLTDDLLYSPVDAFAKSCWETLFPDRPGGKSSNSPHTPAYDPPSYTPFPEIYNIPEGSKSAATLRAASCNKSYLEMAPDKSDESEDDGDDTGLPPSGVYFWDDSDDSGEYDEEVSSTDDEDSDDISTYLVDNDLSQTHPVIDFEFTDNPLLPDIPSGAKKSSIISWESLLPRHMAVAVDLTDTRLHDNKHKKTSRIAALRARLPSIRTSKQSVASDIWL